jgi:hypothetical protein
MFRLIFIAYISRTLILEKNVFISNFSFKVSNILVENGGVESK